MSKAPEPTSYLSDRDLIEAVRVQLGLPNVNQVALSCAIDVSLISGVLADRKGLGPKARLKLWCKLGKPWARDAFLHLFPKDRALLRSME